MKPHVAPRIINNLPLTPILGVPLTKMYGMSPNFQDDNGLKVIQIVPILKIVSIQNRRMTLGEFKVVCFYEFSYKPSDSVFEEKLRGVVDAAIGEFNRNLKQSEHFWTVGESYPDNVPFEQTVVAFKKAYAVAFFEPNSNN